MGRWNGKMPWKPIGVVLMGVEGFEGLFEMFECKLRIERQEVPAMLLDKATIRDEGLIPRYGISPDQVAMESKKALETH